jgi:hypothetical protein
MIFSVTPRCNQTIGGIRSQHVESYAEAAQIRDVNELREVIIRRAGELRKAVTSVSHNNPSNSIYVHALVVYG